MSKHHLPRARHLQTLIALLFLLGAVCSCSGTPSRATTTAATVSDGAGRQAIDEIRQQFNRAYDAADASALAALATNDAVWMPPGEAPITGRAAIAQRYTTQFAGSHSRFTLGASEVQVRGDVAFLTGPFDRVDTPVAGGAPVVTKGKYVMVLERQPDGGWKIARDIWNVDASAQGALAVDAHVALREFVALVEQQLAGVAQSLKVLASVEQVQGGNWNAMRPPMRALAESGLPGSAIWFARPDGSYQTLEQGASAQTLSDRPYFDDLMNGKSILGSLVVSRSTGKRSVVVAQPVARAGRVIGAVGVSLSVDELSRTLDEAMKLPQGVVFYALDAQGQTALHRDPNLMFAYPSDLGDASLRAAVRDMLSTAEGVVRYQFRGVSKVVLHQRAPKLGWVFALGFPAATLSR